MEFGKEVENKLLEYADKEYLEFNKKLNKEEYVKKQKEQIGIRIPILREYSKNLSKEYDLDFLLENINENYYEEIMLKGFIIGQYKKLEWKELEKYISYFVPKISDWAICDTFCSSLKITKKYQKEIWKMLSKYLKSKNEFDVRFALVMILGYYINDQYIDEIYEIINNVKLDKYYVKMANAWLISYCVIEYYDKTVAFLKDKCTIDKWTYNKGIQKSVESFRLSKEQKENLKKMKRLS